MEGHLAQASVGQGLQQAAAGQDAIGEQGRPQATLGDSPHDGNQFIARPQRGLAARDLHIGARAVVRQDQVDAAVNLIEWKIQQRLG